MHPLREHRTPSAGDGVVLSLVALRALRIPSPESRIPRLRRAAEAGLSAEARLDEQRRNTPGRFEHDRPAHLGPARSPFIEHDRDFDVEAAHPGVMGELDLKCVAIGFDPIEVARFEQATTVTLEAAS